VLTMNSVKILHAVRSAIRATAELLVIYCTSAKYIGGWASAQIPIHTFPSEFPVHGEVANLLQTCYGETGVMDFGFKDYQKAVLLT